MHHNLLLGALVSAAFSVHVVAQQNTLLTGFTGCDALVSSGLDDIVVFPGNELYSDSVSTYYSSENRRMRPYCIVQPRSTLHVSKIVKTLSEVSGAGHWDIAVRAGGHSDFDNNAVNRGVTIDLSFLNSTKLDEGDIGRWEGQSKLTEAVVSIGPGARWGAVYEYLEEYGLGTTGGRAAPVGVGGLLVSGGASYHTQEWGFSCDNVVNYEVVLGDGSIIEANANKNKDLFRALKGGGLNLGIVTRFDMRTFTVNPKGAYGGLIFGTWEEREKWVDQFVKYVSKASGSPDHQFLLYRNDFGTPSIMSLPVSTDGRENSTNFAPFHSLNLTRDGRLKQPLSKIAFSINDAGGSHYISYSLTLQATRAIMDKAADIFEAMTKEMEDAGVPVSTNFVFQPMPKEPKKPMDNILGHDENLPADSILFETRHTLQADEAGLTGLVQLIMGRAVEELRQFSASQPGHSPYLYMNYASPAQDVIGSYGEKNVEFLRDTAAKYDPAGFFQTRVPGGWKVSRVE